MWPWEAEPKSVAHGILDDETYDWLAVVGAALRSHGGAIVANEERLVRANEVANAATGIPVDATGSAGLAGLMEYASHAPEVRFRLGEAVAVIFSGVERS
ncbi:MAG: hypothetical protein HYY84_12015 [Deltaproteobacteria bacterium]|nr:hypothetical protein [Deltaproteobacteria bacterium]